MLLSIAQNHLLIIGAWAPSTPPSAISRKVIIAVLKVLMSTTKFSSRSATVARVGSITLLLRKE